MLVSLSAFRLRFSESCSCLPCRSFRPCRFRRPSSRLCSSPTRPSPTRPSSRKTNILCFGTTKRRNKTARSECVCMYARGRQKDEAAGEVPVAFVVRAADADIAEDAIKDFISKQVLTSHAGWITPPCLCHEEVCSGMTVFVCADARAPIFRWYSTRGYTRCTSPPPSPSRRPGRS